MNKYEQYKPSGVEWLGEVPRHWEIEKAKFNFDFSKGLTITKENLVDDGIPCVNYGEIHSKYAFEVNPEIHNLKCVPSEYLEHSQFALLKNGDFIFADTSEDVKGSGNFTHLSSDMPTFAGYHTIIARLAKKHYSKFLAYVFHSEAFRNQIRTQIKGVKVFSITQAILKNTFIWYPSYKEQTTIATYLDERTAYIDRLIAKQQALSEKLSEKRTALITEVVCGRVKISHCTEICFKGSGIQWLGEIPEHWEVSALKFYFDVQLGKMLQPKQESENDVEIPYLKAVNIQWEKIDTEDLAQMWCDVKDIEKYEVKNGDLLVCEGGEVGRCGIVSNLKDRAIMQNAVHRIRPTEKTNTRFLSYFIRHIANSQWFSIICNKATIAHLTSEKLLNTMIVLPPLSEQITIVDFLDTETAKIDRLQAKIGELVEGLKEYRAALITQVVTGKVKV